MTSSNSIHFLHKRNAHNSPQFNLLEYIQVYLFCMIHGWHMVMKRKIYLISGSLLIHWICLSIGFYCSFLSGFGFLVGFSKLKFWSIHNLLWQQNLLTFQQITIKNTIEMAVLFMNSTKSPRSARKLFQNQDSFYWSINGKAHIFELHPGTFKRLNYKVASFHAPVQ